ncbi:UDP-glucose dehydrogenase family protein [Natranaerobius thermophilus]|uniref:UDP-glucose 6-dehydrogenase n=1 Tax=Natranaerobius thermophilus (strain ATCC BAA-1301 / DSM 18059 / JW/NM-WN-LF) TaxID=457570 RepID=B2A4H9_NATTJ|nr:UDP-glucose/GDP-mannose dehydrogenase family protein [Natranaerobius thermophilus]ACB85156.1 nucleotide sugar dehydrogenase [Natranaerobius thermophilus JW/NM-WN-LF]
MTNIGIVGGLGHVGLIQSACLAKLGYKVIAYDIDMEKVKTIMKGEMPFQEQGLTELVTEGLNNNTLSFTSEISDLAEAEIVFICVGTPALPNGKSDLSHVYSAVDQIARNRKKNCIAAVKSTVPIGTSRKLTEYLKDNNLSDKVTMVSNPEFLREGTGVKDFWEPDRIVIGAESKEAANKVKQLYSPSEVPVINTTWENSELIKYASNAFLATKISFINEISQLCEDVGADIRVISKGIGLDPRINPHFLQAGIGFSGPCLDKDLNSLINQFKEKQKKPLILESALQVNEQQRASVVEKLQKHLENLRDKDIAVFGMAFKAETDDVRSSHSLPIIRKLLSLGANITVNDPWVKSPEQGRISEAEVAGVEWISSPYRAAKDKDAVLLQTAWQEYENLDYKKLCAEMKKPLVVDGRNLFNREEMESHGIVYVGVGI